MTLQQLLTLLLLQPKTVQIPADKDVELANTGGLDAKVAPKSGKEKLNAYYKKYGLPSDKPYHDRSNWKWEVAAVGTIWFLTLIQLIPTYIEQIKEEEWLNFAISVFIGAVFLVGPLFAGWMDRKYCPYHEKALMSCSCWGIIQGYCTWLICCVAFVPAVAAVFQIIEDGISASGLTVIGGKGCWRIVAPLLLPAVMAFRVLCLSYPQVPWQSS